MVALEETKIRGTWMSEANVLAIHLTVAEIFHSGSNQWTDYQLTSPSTDSRDHGQVSLHCNRSCSEKNIQTDEWTKRWWLKEPSNQDSYTNSKVPTLMRTQVDILNRHGDKLTTWRPIPQTKLICVSRRSWRLTRLDKLKSTDLSACVSVSVQELLKHCTEEHYRCELQEALHSMLELLKSVNDSMHQIAITGYQVPTSQTNRYNRVDSGCQMYDIIMS